MKLLAFESSAKAAGTALLSDGCLLAEYMQNSGQTHSRTLMELAKNMLSVLSFRTLVSSTLILAKSCLPVW